MDLHCLTLGPFCPRFCGHDILILRIALQQRLNFQLHLKYYYIVPAYLDTVSGFYPRDAMLARVIEIVTCLCPSVRHAPVLCQNEES